MIESCHCIFKYQQKKIFSDVFVDGDKERDADGDEEGEYEYGTTISLNL